MDELNEIDVLLRGMAVIIHEMDRVTDKLWKFRHKREEEIRCVNKNTPTISDILTKIEDLNLLCKQKYSHDEDGILQEVKNSYEKPLTTRKE